MPTNIYPNLKSLCQTAAKMIAGIASQSIIERGQFTIALSGGSTPQQLYTTMASSEWRNHITPDWHFFWSDERLVPLSDERSNYHAANAALLSKLKLDAGQIHAAPVNVGTPDEVAAAYESTIRSTVPAEDKTLPRFDLILLGLGPDGHTASLFPKQPSLNESDRLVVGSSHGDLPPKADRVTFTLPLINASRNVMFLVAGEPKRRAFRAALHRETLAGHGLPPAALVQPQSGKLFWLVDTEAAGPV